MTKQEIPFGRPWIDDRDRNEVLEVLRGHILTHGPVCKAFEEAFVQLMGGGHAATTSSCMAALHLASLHFELGPGDEVLVPAQTHVATAHAIELVGAKPVFIDCETVTGNIDTELLEPAVTKRTKAISLVHFAGIPADMNKIMAIAESYDLKVIEDCALAVGARWNGSHVGLLGDIGCFSFYPIKHITTGEGGMVVSRDAGTVQKIAKFRAFAVDRNFNERQVPGLYDVTGVGMNCRMSEMQAALGRSQLAKIDQILARRAANFDALRESLRGIPGTRVLCSATPQSHSSHYCLVVILEGALGQRRNEIIGRLKEAKIGTSIYYPQPVPRLSYYRERYGYSPGQFQGAETISDRSIALPVGPHLELDHMAAIAGGLKTIVKEMSA